MTPDEAQAAFAADLLLTELEARLAPALDQRLVVAWRGWQQGRQVFPPWPPQLCDRSLMRTVASLIRRLSPGITRRRLQVLEHLALTASVTSSAGAHASFSQRNQIARTLGADNFFLLYLSTNEIAEDTVSGKLVAAPLERSSASAAPLVAALAEISPEQVLDRAVALLQSHRLPVMRGGISIHARSRSRAFAVDPPEDVRAVVGPIADATGWHQMWHELGHMAASLSIDGGLPWPLARVASTCLDEAVAERVALLGEQPSTIARVLGVPMSSATAAAEHLADRRRRWKAWQRARAAFERDAYTKPAIDLDQHWAALVSHHTAEVVAPDSWRDLPHLRVDPGSQAVYLVAADLAETLAACEPERLSAALQHGATHPWGQVVAALERGATPVHDSSTP